MLSIWNCSETQISKIGSLPKTFSSLGQSFWMFPLITPCSVKNSKKKFELVNDIYCSLYFNSRADCWFPICVISDGRRFTSSRSFTEAWRPSWWRHFDRAGSSFNICSVQYRRAVMWKIIRRAFTVFSIGFSRSWFVTMKRLAHLRVSWWQPDLNTVSGATLLACLIEKRTWKDHWINCKRKQIAYKSIHYSNYSPMFWFQRRFNRRWN